MCSTRSILCFYRLRWVRFDCCFGLSAIKPILFFVLRSLIFSQIFDVALSFSNSLLKSHLQSIFHIQVETNRHLNNPNNRICYIYKEVEFLSTHREQSNEHKCCSKYYNNMKIVQISNRTNVRCVFGLDLHWLRMRDFKEGQKWKEHLNKWIQD